MRLREYLWKPGGVEYNLAPLPRMHTLRLPAAMELNEPP